MGQLFTQLLFGQPDQRRSLLQALLQGLFRDAFAFVVAQVALLAQGIQYAHGGRRHFQRVDEALKGGLVVSGAVGGGAPADSLAASSWSAVVSRAAGGRAPAMRMQGGIGHGADGGVGAIEPGFRAVLRALRILQAGARRRQHFLHELLGIRPLF